MIYAYLIGRRDNRMDESRKLDDPTFAGNHWSKEENSTEDMGATGVFGAMPKARAEEEVGPAAEPGGEGSVMGCGTNAAEPSPLPSRGELGNLQEPVVHKVSLLAVSATQPIDILERLRSSPPVQEPSLTAAFASIPPAARPPAGEAPTAIFTPILSGAPIPVPPESAAGFTQLLRSLGGDTSPAPRPEPSAPIRPLIVSPEVAALGQETGFSALLRTLNPEPASHELQKTIPPSEGGFTALMQSIARPNPAQELTPLRSASSDPFPSDSTAAPGAFTQLVNTFTSQSNDAHQPVAFGLGQSLPQRPQVPLSDLPPVSADSLTKVISRIEQPLNRPPAPTDSRDFVRNDSSRTRSPWDTDVIPPADTIGSTSSIPYAKPKDLGMGAGLDTVLLKLSGQSYGAEEARLIPPAVAQAPSGEASFTDVYRRLDQPSEILPAVAPQLPSASLRPHIPAVAMPPTPNLAPSAYAPPTPIVPHPASPSLQAYVPTAPVLPQPPAPAMPQPPAMDKMQQHLPLLLIIIIFLLVVILVTMVFLMKH
jgi:hypothetical protein